MYWSDEKDQPPQVKEIIAQVRHAYPDIKWERLWVRNPRVDDNGIWFFRLGDKPGEVQIENSYGICPFLVETDKHDERFEAETVAQVAAKVIEWLALPGGHQDYFWHPR